MSNFYLRDLDKDNQGLISSHRHKFENEIIHSCGKCMYYKNTEDGENEKWKWCKELEKRFGPCCKVVMHNEAVIGFIMFVPKSELPKLEVLAPGSTRTEAWYIPCIFITEEYANKREKIEKLVIQEILEILRGRKVQKVQIFGANQKEDASSISTGCWSTYEKLGFKKIWEDQEVTVGELVL